MHNDRWMYAKPTWKSDIKRILHKLSFIVIFIKQAFGEFYFIWNEQKFKILFIGF